MILKYKSILFLVIAFAMAGMFVSCSDDDAVGEPRIDYVRVTTPESSDSLLVAAYQGSTIAIMGQNLQGAREIWFNDQKGALSPTMITNTTIITQVPNTIPEEVNHKLVLVFGDGSTLEHNFEVAVNEPVVSRLVNEYALPGETVLIRGNYFYEPVTVTFSGGVAAEVLSVNDDNTIIEVVVPEGAERGPVTVASNFGETESGFWYMDNRNIIASFDVPMVTNERGVWHGPAYIVASDPVIPNINGKFIRINQQLGAWAWFEMYVGEGSGDIGQETRNIPADAIANPDDYVLKFEVNTLAPLTGANIRMYMGADMPGERNDISYNWTPNLHTQGQWETVSIPFNEFLQANNNFGYSDTGYDVSFHFSGPNPVNANFGLDNIRVVPVAAE
ncbi:glycan-binding surface protein [Cesiribacter sp. SM1]|uniref:glycan-binding surface protein n=1 Tax=Cesiribacter sp. SM1 TaxID=2861196 RepID=UPI001CD54AC1|nr:glycan-binding surface protein [Cesiribacter sp. SM1]